MRHSFILLPLLTAGCIGAAADPPSLGPREIEGVLDQPGYAIAPVPSAQDAALAARIADLVAQAEAGNARFEERLPTVRRVVSRAQGGAVESESWIVAQVELSALDATRGETTSAMGALDDIFAEQTNAGTPTETDALLAARDRVDALYAGQAESYGALEAMLRSR